MITPCLTLKKSIFNLIYKIEVRFEKDRGNYEKAINAFIKQADKISGVSAVQKALHLFAKDVVSAVKTSSQLGCCCIC